MDTVTLNAVINEDNQLIVDLPADLPKGPVKLTIEPINLPNVTDADEDEPTIEEIRALLAAAGSLVTDFGVYEFPDDLTPLSEEELDELIRDIPALSRPVEEQIAEDRGDY